MGTCEPHPLPKAHTLSPSLPPSVSDVLKFDNFSWTRLKEVFYHAEVLPPNTTVTEHTMGPADEAAMAAPEEASNAD